MHLPAFFFVIIAYMPCFYSFFCLCGKICDEQGEFHIYIIFIFFGIHCSIHNFETRPGGSTRDLGLEPGRVEKNRKRKNPA